MTSPITGHHAQSVLSAGMGLLLAGVLGATLFTNSLATAEPPQPNQRTFPSATAAADALVAAAEKYDVPALKEILGPDGVDLIATEDPVHDKNQAAAWAEKAREKLVVVTDPKHPKSATLNVGRTTGPCRSPW